MTKTRIYIISNGDSDRLVRAANQSQARNHVARDVYQTRVATQDDLVVALQSGINVEHASAVDEGEE